MSGIVLEILIIALLIVINGTLATAEIAVVTARKARLQRNADAGDASAAAALELARAPGPFLSTIQIGITLVGILAGAFGGATLAGHLGEALRSYPLFAPFSEAIAVAVVVLCITYVTLIIGELVPKRLALHNPEGLASFLARPMKALSVATSPIVRLLTVSTDGVLRLLGIRPQEEPSVTEEDIRLLVQQGTHAGVVQEFERAIVERAFQFEDRRVSSLMLPRTEMAWLDIDDPPDQIRNKVVGHPQSVFPVVEGGLGNVLGVVEAKGLLSLLLSNQPLDLRMIVQPVSIVPESMDASQLLEILRSQGARFACVIDEYGSTRGLVTMYDLMEAIVGDIASLADTAVPRAVRRADGSWLVDGLLPMEDLREMLGTPELGAGEHAGYDTAAGFVLARLGQVPSPADHFTWRHLRFEVVDMDGRRVDKILVSSLPQ